MTPCRNPFNDPQEGVTLSISFEFKVVCGARTDIYKGYAVDLEGVPQTSHICLYTPGLADQWHAVKSGHNLRELLFHVYGGPAEMRFTDVSVLRGDPLPPPGRLYLCEVEFKELVADGRISFIKVELTLDAPAAAAPAPVSKNYR